MRLFAERKCYADVRPEAEASGRLLAGNVPCGGSDGATPKLPLRMLYWGDTKLNSLESPKRVMALKEF